MATSTDTTDNGAPESDMSASEATDSQTPTVTEPAITANDTGEENARFHIVQRKENLYRISLRYNLKMDTLKEWNNLDDSGAIFAGMKLWLIPPEQQEEE